MMDIMMETVGTYHDNEIYVPPASNIEPADHSVSYLYLLRSTEKALS